MIPNHHTQMICIYLHIIPTLLSRPLCRVTTHMQTNACSCYKHAETIYKCRLCTTASNYNAYTYHCQQCSIHYCIHHYIAHTLIFTHCNQCNYDLDCLSDSIAFQQNTPPNLSLSHFREIAKNLCSHNVKVSILKSTQKANICAQFMLTPCIQTLSIIPK